jgi:hypothetical protein
MCVSKMSVHVQQPEQTIKNIIEEWPHCVVVKAYFKKEPYHKINIQT